MQPPPSQPYAPGQAPYGHQAHAPVTKDLDDQSLIWLIVACAGFFCGLSWITGPLSWYFGSSLRNQYRVRGLEPQGTATAAWIIGIVSTAIYGLVFLMIAGMVAFMFLAVGAGVAAGM